jgi:hypothetical protein
VLVKKAKRMDRGLSREAKSVVAVDSSPSAYCATLLLALGEDAAGENPLGEHRDGVLRERGPKEIPFAPGVLGPHEAIEQLPVGGEALKVGGLPSKPRPKFDFYGLYPLPASKDEWIGGQLNHWFVVAALDRRRQSLLDGPVAEIPHPKMRFFEISPGPSVWDLSNDHKVGSGIDE